MVNLHLAAQQIRLDQFALAVSKVLADAEIPHALIKGPTTANWLYDPPRAYSDVDMLVPRSRVDDSVTALGRAGVAHPSGGRLGEEAAHCLMMASPAGIELDLHAALPLMSLPRSDTDDTVWDTLAGHVVDFDIDGVPVPALDVPARCLVLALHSVSGGLDRDRVKEDLRRARRVATGQHWQEAEVLAERLGVIQTMHLGLSRVEEQWRVDLAPLGARLLLSDDSAAFQIQSLRKVPFRRLPKAIWHEAFPSRGFMRRAYPDAEYVKCGLLRAHMRRLLSLGTRLPRAVIVLYRARRHHR